MVLALQRWWQNWATKVRKQCNYSKITAYNRQLVYLKGKDIVDVCKTALIILWIRCIALQYVYPFSVLCLWSILTLCQYCLGATCDDSVPSDSTEVVYLLEFSNTTPTVRLCPVGNKSLTTRTWHTTLFIGCQCLPKMISEAV